MSVSKRDVERLYLQAILSRGTVVEAVAKLLRKKCIEAVNAAGNLELTYDGSEKAWHSFQTNLNSFLDKLDFEFRQARDEDTGKIFYAMVNRKDDEIAQLATDFTPNEIAFLKAVVELIMLADNEAYSVSSMNALRETGNNITKAQGETLLSTFVARGWLTKSKKGRYALAVRSSLELLPYLKSNFADEILVCSVTGCGGFLTRGIACTNTECKVRMHHHCVKAYLRNNNKCPTCKTAWPSQADLVPVGEEAAPHDGSDNRRRTRARTRESSDEEEEEAQMSEDSDDEEAERKSKGKGKAKQTKREADSDADVEMVSEEEKPVKREPRRSSRRQ